MRGLTQSASQGAIAIALSCGATMAAAQQAPAAGQAATPSATRPAGQAQPPTPSTGQPEAGQQQPTGQETPSDQPVAPAAAPDPDRIQSSAQAPGQSSVPTPSPAATTANSDNKSNDVVVTGTRIGRPNITSAAPILSVTSQEIQQQGAINVSDVLNRLPQIAPDNQQTYQDSNGAQQVQLRGLGFNRTLTLVDGLRLSTSEGVNVNSIPVALIDRIDVLTGGGASIYGADAVAGVINFVLKKDFTGVVANGSYSLYDHHNDGNNLGARTANAQGFPTARDTSYDGGTANFNIAVGHRFFNDRLKVQAYFGYVHTDPITVTDRDFSSCYLTQSGQANTAPTCLTSRTTPFEGIFTPQTGPNAGSAFSNAQNGTRTFVANGPANSYQPFTADYLQHQVSRYNAGAFVNFDVTSHLSIYVNYLMSHDTSYSQFGPAALFNSGDYGYAAANWTLNCNNPLLSAQQQRTLCGANAGTAATVPVALRYGFGTNTVDKYTNFDQRVSAGLRGRFFRDVFKFDANFVYSRAVTTFRPSPLDGQPDYNRTEAALNGCVGAPAGCVPLDVFRANSLDQNALDYVFGTQSGRNSNAANLYDYTVNLSGDFGKLGIRSPFATDGLVVGIGGEYRVDKEVNTVDALFLTQGSGGNFRLSQNVKEAYIEASAPLLQDQFLAHLLSVNGSYRWSKYQISPRTFTTWSVAGVYAPVSDVTFRVAYNKASRQPTVYEYGNGLLTYGGGSSDPCAGATPSAPLSQCQNTGVTAAQYGNIPQCDNNSCLARNSSGHPDPETAHTLTYGAIVKPRFIPGLTLSADHFDITVDDQIGYFYDSDYTNNCLQFGIPFYCSHIFRNPDGSLTSADRYVNGTSPATGFVTYGTTNVYKFVAKGYDIQGQYTLPIAPIGGKLDFVFNGTLTTVRGGQDGPPYPLRNGAGFFGPIAGQPRPKWNHSLRTTYTTSNQVFSLSANWRHIGGTTATANSGDPALGAGPNTPVLTLFGKLPNYDYIDLSASVNIAKRYTLTLIANNLFDTTPPIVPDSYNQYLSRANTIPQTYDALGRFLQVSVSVKF